LDVPRDEARCLRYDDFRWRVGRVARERSAWSADTEISAAAVVGARPWDDGQDLALLVFLYEIIPSGDGSPARIAAPHAALALAPDGEVASFDALRTLGGTRPQVVGPRFGPKLARARPHQRGAARETYYFALTLDDGPLLNPWSRLTTEQRHDLASFFEAVVEPPLRPLLAARAPDFMSLLAAKAAEA